MKKMIVSLADIVDRAGDSSHHSKPPIRNLACVLERLQLIEFCAYLSIVHIDAVYLGERVDRLVDLVQLFIAQAHLVSERLILVLGPVRYLQASLEPHHCNPRHLLSLEAHSKHVATMDVVRVAAVQPGNSECHLEFFDRLIEQFHILVGKSEAEMHFEVHQRSKVAGRTFQFFKDGLELISRWSSLNHC